ncbi:MAG: hypothetical protein JWQ40_1177 [Segetibacter sp.]|nr:hypothetical protein [Segetibacter sp.]
MTVEEFNKLDDQNKKVLIFEASKIAERNEDFKKFELFNIDDFFVEIMSSRFLKFRRTMAVYTQQDLPLVYSHNVQSIFA